VVLNPNRSVPLEGQGAHWHYHRAVELTFIQKGKGTRFLGDHIELFDSDDLVLIGSNVPHYWHMRGVSRGLSTQWEFPIEHGIWNFAESALLTKMFESARRGLQILGATGENTRRRLEQLPSLAGLARLAVFLQILDGLSCAPSTDLRPLSQQPFSLSGSAEQQEAIRRAVSYILANYRGTVNLSELLHLTGMSRATFTREFRRHAGRPFSTFLNGVRLQAVCRALGETTELVGNIAMDHGFNQLSFFNRLFRREIGVNPSVYRANRRQEQNMGTT
jgi:AraC-like DNA-binding protein